DFIEKLEQRHDRLWITDVVSAHQYETERNGGDVQVVEASNRMIRLKLTSKVDPQLYDAPLTLITQIPSGWQRFQVAQGSTKTIIKPLNGTVRFNAIPNAGDITLEP